MSTKELQNLWALVAVEPDGTEKLIEYIIDEEPENYLAVMASPESMTHLRAIGKLSAKKYKQPIRLVQFTRYVSLACFNPPEE